MLERSAYRLWTLDLWLSAQMQQGRDMDKEVKIRNSKLHDANVI
jgi:hypothetical protein